MTESPFQTRTVGWVAGVAGASLALAIALALFGPELAPTRTTAAANAYSRSALGHGGLVEALERLGIPVVVSRSHSAGKARASGVLVLAEPTHGGDEAPDGHPRLASLIESSEFTLLVLPKRRGRRLAARPGWVESTWPLDLEQVEAVLREAGLEIDLRRVAPDTVEPILSRVGTVPSFERDEDVQVIAGPGLLPLVTTNGGGTLLAHVTRHPGLYVLSDPDPLSNADLRRGDNLRFVLDVLDHVRDGFGSVVFDETIHGFDATPTIWRELLAFPLVLVPLHLILVLALVLWAGMGRFGTPRAARPPLEPGKGFLVDRTAELLRYGKRSTHALPRYLDVAIRDARHALDAPVTLKSRDLEDWLDRIAENRGVADRIDDLRAVVETSHGHPSAVLEAAHRIHDWRTEIVHGSQ